jgi:hypothetical protein
MPFIGNQPALSYTSFAKQDFTTSATTSYTLDNPVTNANELALFINFVRQEPTTAYSASGTSLTLTSATSATDDMYCVFLGKAVQTVNPPNASVGASQIVDSSIALGKLSATGTKDATTFLRGDNTFAEAGGKFESQLFHVRDEKSSNTAGGSCSATSDNQRDLNTILTNEITGASLSSNVITLPAGTFFISASSPTNRGGTNRAHLLNTVSNSITLLGTSENTQTGDTTPTRSFINGRFIIGSSTTFRIRHYTTAAKADNGLGIQANDGRTEVYTDVLIWKVA